MIHRRRFVRSAGLALVLPRLLAAQTSARVYRIGILLAGINPRSASFIGAFERRLGELGWVQGKNITIDFASGETREQLEKAASRLLELQVDAIVAPGPELCAEVARAATSTIPIVIVALNYDPVQKGYARSFAQPGRNITGIYYRNPEIGAKQIELLHAALPAASRISLLWTRYSADQVPPVDTAVRRFKLQIEKVELRPPYDISAAFTAIKEQHVSAVLALGDPVTYRERERIADFAIQGHIPIVGQPWVAQTGGLLGFGPDLDMAMASGAEYVDKILRGASPATMPIDQPAKFRLIVNLKSAKALGVSIPQAVLLRADEVIE